MENSILTSVKKSLMGVTEDDTAFDDQILLHINNVFPTLHQLGVGPTEGFSISGKEETWDDFVTDKLLQNFVKGYVVNKVKLAFDPPASSFVLSSLEKQTEELTWRINVRVDEIEYNKS